MKDDCSDSSGFGGRSGLSRLLLAMAFALGLGHYAQASIPTPYDVYVYPPNINAVTFYDEYNYSGSFFTPSGQKLNHTRIVNTVEALRFDHTMPPIGGVVPWDVALLAPLDVNFIGQQKVGGEHLTANSGLTQTPTFGVGLWPYAYKPRGISTFLVFFVSTPGGAYSPSYNLNAGLHAWQFDLQGAYAQNIWGTPTGNRVAVSLWWDEFFTTENNDVFVGNRKAKLHTQPEGRFEGFISDFFGDRRDSFVGVMYVQTFGGKQYINSPLVPGNIDTGSRAQSISVGPAGGTFITRRMLFSGYITTSPWARGGPRSDFLSLLRLTYIF